MADYDGEESGLWRWLTDARVLWVAIAVIGVLALLANVGVWLGDDDGIPGDSREADAGPPTGGAGESTLAQQGHESSGAGTGAGATSENMQSVLDTCGARWTEQGRPLLSAEASMDHWRLHITAMNRLVAGEITLAQASDFWEQTRRGAIHRIERFHTDYAGYRSDAPGCPSPGAVTGQPSTVSDNLKRCVAAVWAGERILTLADAAITTWEHHVHDMEMLRSGQLTPAQATTKWQESWRAGNRQLNRYVDAEQAALDVHCQ